MKSVIKESKKALGELDEETVIKDLKEKLDYKELREDIKEFRKKFAQLIEEEELRNLSFLLMNWIVAVQILF